MGISQERKGGDFLGIVRDYVSEGFQEASVLR